MIGQLVDFGVKLLERVLPDPEKRLAAQIELLKLQQSGELQSMAGQLEVNKLEAVSSDKFSSRWRPAAGWISVTGFAFAVVLGPLLSWIAALVGHPTPYPELDLEILLTILGGMLGLGSLRTYEKAKGVTK